MEYLLTADLLKRGISPKLNCTMQVDEGRLALSRDKVVFCNGEGDIPLVGLRFLEDFCNFQRLRNAPLGGIEVDHVPEE